MISYILRFTIISLLLMPNQVRVPGPGGETPGGGGGPTTIQASANSHFGSSENTTTYSITGATSGNILLLHAYLSVAGTIGTSSTPTGCVASWGLVGVDAVSPNTRQALYAGVFNTTSCTLTVKAQWTGGGNADFSLEWAEVHNSSGLASIETFAFGTNGYCNTCDFASITTAVDKDMICGFEYQPASDLVTSAPWVFAFYGLDSGAGRHLVSCYVKSPAGTRDSPAFTSVAGDNSFRAVLALEN